MLGGDPLRGEAAAPPRVSVILPALNAAATLGAQLDALRQQDLEEPLEVIVADNGSTDDTVGVVGSARAAGLDVRVVDASGEPSAAHARNTGAAAARGDVLLFCDADDVAAPGWARAMVRELHDHDGVGGHLEPGTINSRRVAEMRRSSTRNGLPRAFGRWPVPVGASCGLTADRFVELGGFDESFPAAGGEDTDLFIRLQLAGGTVAWAPDAVMHYRNRPTHRAQWRQAKRNGRANTALYIRYRSEGLPPWRPGRFLRRLAGVVKSVALAPFSIERRGHVIWWCGHTAGQMQQSWRERVVWFG